ncbi:MAG: hypothetical protein VW338_04750 [Rhodospirillaceae bacterium]
MVEELVHLGHPDAIDYTPRAMQGWLYFAARRRRRELAGELAVAALAASGDGKSIKKQIKTWERDW